MSPLVLTLLVLLPAKITLVLSIVALQNPLSNIVVDLEDFLPSKYRALRARVCDIIVLSSELPKNWASPSRPVKLSSNFSHAGLVTKCTFLYVFCDDQDALDIAQWVHNFILVQKKLMGNIYLVVLFLQDNYDQHVKLEKLAEVINKRVVFASNGSRIRYTNHDRSCQPQDLKCALRGRMVRVGYSQHKPYIYFADWIGVDDPRNHEFVLSRSNVHSAGAKLVGTEANLLKVLCEQYNMTLKLRLYQYGTELPNGTWVGKLGVVKAGGADIVVGRLSGNYRRNQIAHHSNYLFYYCFSIISLKPGLLSSLFAPLCPFTQGVWYGIGVSVVLVGVSLWLVGRFRAWLFNLHCEFTVLQAVVFVADALLNVPWSASYYNRVPKFLAGIWLLMAAILQASYSSRLMLSYSIMEYEKSPETVQDLISMGRTAVVFHGGTSSSILSRYDNLQIEKLPHEVTPAELTATKVTLSNPSDYVFKILGSGGRPLSDYYLGRKPILQIFSGWLYSFEFALKPEIDVAILRAGQVGLLSKWTSEQQTLLRQQQKDGEGGDNHPEFKNAPISLWNLQAVFLVFIVGNLLATVAFTGEQIMSFFRG